MMRRTTSITRTTPLVLALLLVVVAAWPAAARPLEGDGVGHGVTATQTDAVRVASVTTAAPQIHLEELTRDADTSVRGRFTDELDVQLRVRLEGDTDRRVLNVGDPTGVAVARITAEPGAQFPWHTHPGPVVVSVVEGELTYVNADDCIERVYPAGTAFVDPGLGNVHTAFNAGGEDAVLVATFLGATDGTPLTITDGVEAPDDCEVGSDTP